MSKIITDSANYTAIANAIRGKGVSGTFTPAQMAAAIASISTSSGGSDTSSLPSGISAMDFGSYEVSANFTTSSKTITHNLGVTPDFVMFFYDGGNIATTYSMLWSIRSTKLWFRSSAYNLFNAYHGNSTTTVTMANSNSTSIGVNNLSASSFKIASHSTSYYWRGGYTYKWMAIKFG